MSDARGSIHDFASQLEDGGIRYRLDRVREDAVLFDVAVPGERWEIEFMRDGGVEVEVFRSDGTISGLSVLDDLLRRFAD